MLRRQIQSTLLRAITVCASMTLLVASSSAIGREKVIHTFLGRPGRNPSSRLVFDAAGHLYGTTSSGGHCTYVQDGCGIVFELTPTPTGWSYSVLYVFKGHRDGASPEGKLTLDAAGNLYGTTFYGGAGEGTVFELSPTSDGGWTETVLHRFQGGKDGAFPLGGVALDSADNLYGATVNGGTGCSYSCGTVYELSPSSGGWTEKILHNFKGFFVDGDGAYPEGGVGIDTSGNLFGTTLWGGTGRCSGNGGCGTVFEVARGTGGRWHERLVYEFQGGNDGENPYGDVAFDPSGNLYSTTTRGGSSSSCGTVFQLKPKPRGSWTETILHRFLCDKVGPGEGGVTLDTAGNIYGTASGGGSDYGVIFKLESGTKEFSLLHSFTGNRDGAWPNDLILDSTGSYLYGTAYQGGIAPNYSGFGVVFKIAP